MGACKWIKAEEHCALTPIQLLLVHGLGLNKCKLKIVYSYCCNAGFFCESCPMLGGCNTSGSNGGVFSVCRFTWSQLCSPSKCVCGQMQGLSHQVSSGQVRSACVSVLQMGRG